MFKIDIFILKKDPGSKEEMARRQSYFISEEKNSKIYLASAEDVIVHKLHWYKIGNKISERQWLDVLGVIQVQRDKLDYSYLEKAAEYMKVVDLLNQALES